MKIPTTLLLALCLALPAMAGRLLPATLQAGTIAEVDDTTVAFVNNDRTLLESLIGLFIRSDRQFQLAPGLRIFDENNRFLMRGQLAQLAGRTVGITFNAQDQIDRLWVLSDEEVEQLKAREQAADSN